MGWGEDGTPVLVRWEMGKGGGDGYWGRWGRDGDGENRGVWEAGL